MLQIFNFCKKYIYIYNVNNDLETNNAGDLNIIVKFL